MVRIIFIHRAPLVRNDLNYVKLFVAISLSVNSWKFFIKLCCCAVLFNGEAISLFFDVLFFLASVAN